MASMQIEYATPSPVRKRMARTGSQCSLRPWRRAQREYEARWKEMPAYVSTSSSGIQHSSHFIPARHTKQRQVPTFSPRQPIAQYFKRSANCMNGSKIRHKNVDRRVMSHISRHSQSSLGLSHHFNRSGTRAALAGSMRALSVKPEIPAFLAASFSLRSLFL